MKTEYILSIDQSTAGTKALIWTLSGQLVSRLDVPHKQITNAQGWVEHDPVEIFENVLAAVRGVLEQSGINPADIGMAGISNQRETAVCWDKTTGAPLYNAIVWQCGRATDIVNDVAAMGLKETVRAKTGLALSPFFSAAKFSWIVRHVSKAQEALARGTLCCGTVDTWLLYCLTGKLKTDYSNASRTQLLNLNTLEWDPELLKAFSLEKAIMPEICMSDSLIGTSTFGGIFQDGIAIHGVMGDSHAALFGNRCLQDGMAKITYGTGSSIMVNVGSQRPQQAHGVVTSIAWGMQGSVVYAIEGNINYSGAVTKWLVDDVELLDTAKDAGRIAAMAESTNGVYLVPAFSGLGAPYFNNDVRAAFVGMNRTTKRVHLVRAAEECIAYQITDVVNAVNGAIKTPLVEICADGGPTHDDFLMQFQADMLNLPININCVEELSGAGAAYCAALGAELTTVDKLFKNSAHAQILPHMEQARRTQLYSGWQAAVSMLAGNGGNE
ncbi:MAG: FGGY-family carbohydrate kinase [Oscillospiraceae bacterium]